MTTSNKKFVIAGLVSGLLLSFGVAFNGSALSVKAAASDIYYHYEGRPADFANFGIREYWTNCKGDTTIEKPAASKYIEFKDAGIEVPATMSKDDPRYIAPETAGANNEVPTSKEIQSVTIIPTGSGNTTSGGAHGGTTGSTPSGSSTPIVVDQDGKNTGLIIEEVDSKETTQTVDDDSKYNVVGYEGEDETLIIPEGIISIDTWNYHPFNGNTNENVNQIETVVIPSTVTELTVQAFENMPNLETIVIGAQLLRYGCIQNCPKLKYIYITKDCTVIDSTPFRTSGTQDIKIFCEAESKPAGWIDDWNVSTYDSWPHPRYETKWGVKY